MSQNFMVINGERYPVINAWVEVESPSDGRKRWGIVTEPGEEVQPAAPAGATHPLMGVPLPEGIPDDVILSVTTSDGPVLQLTLIMAALLARTQGRSLLPFVYRDPYDPELPDAPRPLRRASLAIIDDRIAETQPAAAGEGFKMPEQLLSWERDLVQMDAEGKVPEVQDGPRYVERPSGPPVRVDGPGCTPFTVYTDRDRDPLAGPPYDDPASEDDA